MPKKKGGSSGSKPNAKKGRASRYGDGPSDVRVVRYQPKRTKKGGKKRNG